MLLNLYVRLKISKIWRVNNEKIISITLVMAMMLSLASCTSSTTSPSQSSTPAPTPSDSSSTAAPEKPQEEKEWRSYDADGKTILTDRDATGKNGVVSSSRYEASKAGISIIEKGGNAVDAAVATAFALGVAEPQSSGIGGGGFMTVRIAETGETLFIDFREIAPKNASPDMWKIGDDGKVVNNEKMAGGKSVGVPGEVAGLTYALEKYGTMSLKEVMQPAIDLATNGFEVTPILNTDFTNSYDKFLKFPEMGKVFLTKDELPYAVGDMFKNPDLAKTLTTISEKGADAFYKGEIAQAIVDSVKEAGGVLEMEDLANYKIEVRTPVSGTYRGYEIISSPPPSSGGTHIIQILNMMENYDISKMEIDSPEYLHLISEIFKVSFADRGKYMGDTDFVEVPLKGLVSKEYAKELIKKIDMEKSQEYGAGDPWKYEHTDTTHFSVADKDGNIVSVTKTINGSFGSGVVAKNTGIIMNNEMGDFDTGAGKANSVEPGKKPLSSMSPTIILKDGKPFVVVGSPGGVRIITTVVQVISNVIDRNMDVQEAIDAPRIYDNLDYIMGYEGRISKETVDKLVAMGHKVTPGEEWSKMFGSVHAIEYKADGTIRGGADPRKDGKALAY